MDDSQFLTGQRVLVCRGSDGDRDGTIVEDFAETAGYAVRIGDVHIVDASRRWAVLLDDGSLVFVDTKDLRVPGDAINDRECASSED